jgi:hypothetical protein
MIEPLMGENAEAQSNPEKNFLALFCYLFVFICVPSVCICG